MPPDPTLNTAVVVALAMAAGAWQVVTLAARGRLATIGDFFRLLQVHWTVRVVLLAGWFWLGWHFFVRGSW